MPNSAIAESTKSQQNPALFKGFNEMNNSHRRYYKGADMSIRIRATD
jgi:hypothetical protein